MHSLIKNTGIYALGDILPRLLSFITFPILTRYLAPDDYAVVSYVNTINTFLPIITFLCLNTYYLVYYYRMENEEKQKELFSNITIFIIFINVFLTILLFIFGKNILSAIGSSIAFFPYIAIAIIINFFNIFGILPAALFRVQERPLFFTLINIVKGILTMIITITLVVFFGYKTLGVLYSMLIVSVVFWFFFLKITLDNMLWNINIKQLKEALVFSLPLLPGSLAIYVVSMLDRVFIEKYLNLFDLGIYSTASTIAMMLKIVSYGAYKAFEPFFFKIFNTDGFTDNFIKVHNYYLIVLIFGAMGLSVFAKEFLHYFASPGYQISYYYVPMIMAGIVFSSINMLFSTIMAAQGKTKLASIITVIGGVISCILNIILLPIIGLNAACLSSGIAFGIMLIINIYYVKVKMNYLLSIYSLLLSSITIWFLVYKLSFDQIVLTMIVKSLVIIIMMLLIMAILQLRLQDIKRYMKG